MARLPLPTDVIRDILSCLPVKSLLRFRSVSKLWCSVIDSHRFITLHLNKSLQTNSNLSLIIHSMEPLLSLDFDSFQNLTRIPHPFLPGFPAVLGSCNGLLLLQGMDMGITLFNPATRKHFIVPYIDFDRPHTEPDPHCHLVVNIVFGLGFDPVADDFKVIRLVQFIDDDNHRVGSESRVYSLKSKTWKKIKEFPYSLPFAMHWGVPLEGGFHAIVEKNYDSDWPKLLVSIDFATEDYKILPLPKIPDEKLEGLSLEILGKCLCLLVPHKEFHLEFWVMKEYGVGESWTKLLCTPRPVIDLPIGYLHILAYSKCGKNILFTDNKKFFWFNEKRRGFVNIPVRSLPMIFSAYVCVNSLVRPDAYGKQKKEKTTRKQRDTFLSKGFKLKL